MASPFLAEIRAFPFNFAPQGWAFCNGQLLPISQNTALFSLLGTFYGGDGKSTFALPNLQGAAAIGQGGGPGLSVREIGEVAGAQSVTLLQSEIPAHTHEVRVDPVGPADESVPGPGAVLSRSSGGALYRQAPAALEPLAPQALTPAGGSLPHNNLQPYLALNYCIALQGIFPQRP